MSSNKPSLSKEPNEGIPLQQFQRRLHPFGTSREGLRDNFRPIIDPIFDPEHSDVSSIPRQSSQNFSLPRSGHLNQAQSRLTRDTTEDDWQTIDITQTHETTSHSSPERSIRPVVEQAEETGQTAPVETTDERPLPPRPLRPLTLLSLTPALLPPISENVALSNSQRDELRRITRHEDGQGGHDIPINPIDNVGGEPPDGGWLAWAHILMGFIVCFNAQ